MQPHVLAKIFDPYFTTKEKGKGTGLGLAVVHGIVRNLKGMIQVESSPGKGSMFRIWFPAIQAHNIQDSKEKQQAHGGREHVLLVDDEVDVVAMCKQMLERLGYRVTDCTSSESALELFRSNPSVYDVVITDMAMPKMTGDRLASAMMKIRPDLPVILCTGYSEKLNEEAAQLIGIQRYLIKPVSRNQLTSAIREVLDGKGSKVKGER
jgi:CheY-like chemotaxis protein